MPDPEIDMAANGNVSFFFKGVGKKMIHRGHRTKAILSPLFASAAIFLYSGCLHLKIVLPCVLVCVFVCVCKLV